MRHEGAPRPPLITVPEPPVPDRPDRPEGSVADALHTFLLEPLKEGLKETYRVLVTPDIPPRDEPSAAPEPIVIFAGQAPEFPPVAPPADAERIITPAPPPVSPEERADRQHTHVRIDEILAELATIDATPAQR